MRKPQRRLLLSAAVLVSICYFMFYCSNETAESAYNAGMKAYQNLRFKKAIVHFQNAIELDPWHERAYKRVVDCWQFTQDSTSANAYLSSLIEKYPDNPLPSNANATVLSRQKHYEEAADYFRKVMQLDPHRTSGYKGLVNNLRKADRLEEARQIMADSIAARPENANAHYGLALVYYHKKEYEPALSQLAQVGAMDSTIADANYLKMNLLWRTELRPEAIEFGKRCLQMASLDADPEWKIRFLIGVGRFYYTLGEMTEAMAAHQEALHVSQKNGLIREQGEVLNNLGVLQREIAQYDDALRALKTALVIQKKTSDKEGEGMALGNIGDIYVTIAKYDSALAFYETALKIAQELKDLGDEAIILGSISTVHFYKGDLQKSIEYGERAVAIEKENDFRASLAYDLGNLGTNYMLTGEFQKAMDYFTTALRMSEELEIKQLQMLYLSNIGETYNLLGSPEIALRNLEKAQQIAHDIQSKDHEATCMGAQATAHLTLGDTTRALTLLKRALDIFLENDIRRDAATTFANLAAIYTARSDFAPALTNLDSALAIHEEIGYKFGLGESYNELGNLYQKMQNYEQAVRAHEQALALGQELNSSLITWKALLGLGDIGVHQNKNAEAVDYYKRAIDVIESIRNALFSEEEKSGFLADKIAVYNKLIEQMYLMQQKGLTADVTAEAFHYSEKAKARSLLDILVEARINIRAGVDPALKEREKSILHNISRIQTAMRSETASQETLAQNAEALQQAEENLRKLRVEFKKKNPQYASLIFPEPLTLKQVQKALLNSGDLLIEYSLGEGHSYMWAIARDRSALYQLPPKRLITEKLDAYFAYLSAPRQTNDIWMTAYGRDLFNILLSPAQEMLQRAQNLIIVPEGKLYFIPFETLITNVEAERPHYLIESCNIRYIPSASVLATIKQRDKKRVRDYPKQFLAFGDPLFQASALASAQNTYRTRGFDLEPLPATLQEITEIAKLFPKNQSRLYSGAEAQEENLKLEDLTNYRYLHFATHGLLDEQLPQRSCLVLALDDDPREDGYLQTQEIFNLKIASDLVVLSACQSGQGKLIEGEGLVGLTRAFLYAGATDLVVSLWRISDQPTADLMVDFYRNLKSGLSPEAALRQSKINFIKHEDDLKRHPFFWAPFVLIGDGG